MLTSLHIPNSMDILILHRRPIALESRSRQSHCLKTYLLPWYMQSIAFEVSYQSNRSS
jgi:hypothetical protein